MIGDIVVGLASLIVGAVYGSRSESRCEVDDCLNPKVTAKLCAEHTREDDGGGA
jgi:hypothetical protein